ncbi:MAG TPA: ABC-2 family transporter protein [Microlunatus sp.]|nr:ABC-2 family transporter protein [Microlunatus sp.]
MGRAVATDEAPRPLQRSSPWWRRYAALWRAVVVQAIRRDLQFRAQAWATGMVALAELAVGLVPVLLIGQSAPDINGWTASQLLAVAGCYQVAQSLLSVFVAPNVMRLSEYVQRGELDGMLLRPVDAQWLTSFRWLQPAALTGALAGSGLVVVGLFGESFSLPRAALALLCFVCGCVLLGAVWTNLAYLAFWFEAANFVHDLAIETFSAGRYPVTLFPSLVRAVLVFVVPVGIASTLPIQLVVADASPYLGLVAVGLAALFLALTRLHWRLAVRRYASASS